MGERESDSVGKTRPYKLTPPLTRDSVLTWDYNMKAFIRQTKAWRQFLPSGTKNSWMATKGDDTNGLRVMKEDNTTQSQGQCKF